jgi:prefoldin subunit 5
MGGNKMDRKCRIVIKRQTDSIEDVERGIDNIKKSLEALKEVCENRQSEDFPINIVRDLVKYSEDVKSSVKDIQVPAEYFLSSSSGNAVEYFQKAMNDLDEQEKCFQRKKDCYKRFRERLEDIKEKYF